VDSDNVTFTLPHFIHSSPILAKFLGYLNVTKEANLQRNEKKIQSEVPKDKSFTPEVMATPPLFSPMHRL
jgi:hypothetical protein